MNCFLFVFLASVADAPPYLEECIAQQQEHWTRLNWVSATIRADSPNRPENVFSRRFRLCGASFVLHTNHDSGKPAGVYHEAVFINNTRYCARALRPKESDSLTVRYVGPPTEDLFKSVSDPLHKSLFFPVAFRSRTLQEWLQTPGFAVRDLKKVEKDGREFADLSVAYQNAIQNTKEEYECPFEGVVVMDPANQWRIMEVRFDVTFRFAGSPVRTRKFAARATYGHESDVYQAPLRVEHFWQRESANLEPYSTWYVDRIEPCTAEDEGFRLTAFGLPEPPGVDWKPPTPWWLWAIGIALAAVVGGAGFTWLKRRAIAKRTVAAGAS